jgi:hypothetical protein
MAPGARPRRTCFIREVRKIKTPLSDDLKQKLFVLLAERAKKALGYETFGTVEVWERYGLAESGYDTEPTLQEVWDFFFQRGTQQEQDNRLLKFRKRLLAELKEELRLTPAWLDEQWPEKADKWPTKWITGDKRIRENLKRKGCQHFFRLMNFLWDCRIGPKASLDLASERGWDSDLVLVIPDWSKIESKLGIRQPTARHYIEEMDRCGIVIKQGLDGESGPAVYAIGIWTKGKSRFPKPDPFLKNTALMRQALRDFDPVSWAKRRL